MGCNSKFHHWQIAYKFPQKEITSVIRCVVDQVGRTGVITPVAILEPTEILGTTVKRATLHNYHHLKKLDIGLNDIIILEKGGEIIPKVVGLKMRSGISKPINVPEFCPKCKSNDIVLNDTNIAKQIIQE